MMKKIAILFICTLFLGACEEKPQTMIEYIQHYAFENNSGVKVAIVNQQQYPYIPDSLVIENGTVYSWGIDMGLPITEKDTDPIKVYFNETVIVEYTNIDYTVRDPRRHYYYTHGLLENGREARIYTFTVEDYQRALELNNTNK